MTRRALRWAAVVVVGLVLVVPLALRPITGFEILVVGDGTMAPALRRGDVLLTRAAGGDLRLGQVVVVGAGAEGRIHRLVEVDGDRLLLGSDADDASAPAWADRSAETAVLVTSVTGVAAGAIGLVAGPPGTVLLLVVLAVLVLPPPGRARRARPRTGVPETGGDPP